ncbi:MAG: hypothetical protein BZ138_07990 [Methanosphaera sp. rholeuAM270]|nr:MAG: hypothetical protein BZ138_07990 [Methanosphaera sp. rholeuAM270]
MLSNIMEERKGAPFILIRKREPTQYPQYPYETEYRIFYDYTDNKYYQSGNEELKGLYTNKQIQDIFKELTNKANTEIKLPESKIYLNFGEPNEYGKTQYELHKGVGMLTELSVENGEVTSVKLLTYYPDWSDIFRQPQEGEYEFNNVTLIDFEEEQGK